MGIELLSYPNNSAAEKFREEIRNEIRTVIREELNQELRAVLQSFQLPARTRNGSAQTPQRNPMPRVTEEQGGHAEREDSWI